MDFKKCSEVYGYKSIAEVEEEAIKLKMVDAMLAMPKLTDEDISVVSGLPQEEIQKRRALRNQGL